MRGNQRLLLVGLVALAIGLSLSGVAGAAVQGELVSDTTDATPTPTPSDDLLGDTTDSTTETVDDTVDDTTNTVDDTTDSTTGTVDDTVDDTTNTVDDTTDSTTGTVDDTVDDTTDSTTDTVDDTTDSTSDTINDTTNTLTDTTDDTTDTITDTTAALLEDASLLDADDSLFTVSTLSADSDESSTQYAYDEPADTEPAFADSEKDASSADLAATNPPLAQRLPSGPGPTAVGATAAAGIGAVAAGAVLGNGSGVGRSLSSRVSGTLGRLVRMLVPFRYSSYDGSDPLDHDDRAAINDYVTEQPGAYMMAVSEAVGVNHSTARHHIKILEREGLVESAKVRGRRRLFPAHSEQQELAAAMVDESTATILEAIARLGPCSGSALAEEVDKSISTVSHHLSRLADDDLVVREKDGRATVNRLPDDVQEALAPEREPVEADVATVSAD